MSDEQKPGAPARPNFPQMEEEVSAFWKKQRIFERSIEERPESKTFAFYDGPPFATGLPHYGHLLQSAIKDAVPRYQTMKGFRVPRRWGWDCHGLPVENLIEKELKLNSKREVETYGIDKFNAACKASVLTYVSEWKRYVERLGRWVDFDGAYKTMDASYTESVWWAFGELWKKGFIYEDLRVSLYCPRCATPLSNFEIAMGNSYIDAQDPAVTVKFKVKGEDKTYFLAWTTTPWTLPANVALAVHPDQIYVRVRLNETGETLIFADALMSTVLREHFPLKDTDVSFEVLNKMKGSELAGLEYEPLYPLGDQFETLVARPGKNRFKVVAMEYVTVTDGTGIVHTAPAFGEEDFSASKAHDLPVLVTVDEEGKHKAEIALVAGMPVKASNDTIMEDLEKRGLLYRKDTVSHSIAVCWRCATHLIYKAQPAWFVNITKLKPKLLETAKKINWHPDHFKDGRFGKGLEGAPDWCISRTRFWGAPIPVWKCKDCAKTKAFTSIAELETASGKKFPREKDGIDLHRPGIDAFTVTCDCGGVMHRIPDVFDVWFDSGSMPFAAEHYPFEQKDWFDQNFPADFIGEAQDQTRGWFYVLHVLATALFGKPAFQHVIVTGLLMAEDGKKMSKSLKNYPDPWELMTRVGADTLRVYLLSSPVLHAEQLNFSERDCETIQRTLFGTLWNVRAFYLMYAGEDHPEIVKPRSMQVLDRWLMARLNVVIQEMTNAMDNYDLVAAIRPLRGWVDDLSTWWLRRSRERMKGADDYDRQDALRTLREALLETANLFAPFAPFFAEKLYQDLAGSKMSVHLDRWPKADERVVDVQLLEDMKSLRAMATATHEARATSKMPVRQALGKLTIRFKDPSESVRFSQRVELLNVLKDEVNVEQIIVLSGTLSTETDWEIDLDTTLTPELKRKGMAREVSRQVMNLRKQLGLTPQDQIVLEIAVEDMGLKDALETFSAQLATDTKAAHISIGHGPATNAEAQETLNLEGKDVQLSVRRA
jgi:isoleucyl-tRNA synthetase